MTESEYFTQEQETILIVDDSELNRAILVNLFSGMYHTLEAESGQEAMELLLQWGDRIRAVLLDVVMPVMDGMEVLERLNQMGWTEKIPVFLITAESADQTLQRAYALGVMDVIPKPVIPYVVERRINSVIELFRARRRLSHRVEEQQSEIFRQAQQIIELNVGMIETLSTAIEFRSGESGAHVRRIHDITRHMLLYTDLGEGMSEDTITQIALASIMHDVGKIAIPDAILNKPGRLTAEEFEVMKTHTLQGGCLLERIPQMRSHDAFQYAYDIARHHHERWDGRGYPDGLKGDENTIWSQVVSIADVYDALVSKRVYKDPYSVDEALAMIREGKCGVFSQRLMDRFFSVERELRAFYGKEQAI